MGSHGTTYVLIALAIALVCILIGFLWGRSDIRSKIEDALEKEHVSLDAREFAMRQQLDEAIDEITRLRPLAEELGRVQERLKNEQLKYEKMRAEFNVNFNGAADEGSTQQPEQAPTPPPAPESADAAIQRLLQSLEENLSGPGELAGSGELASSGGLAISAEAVDDAEPTVAEAVETQQTSATQPSVPPVENRPAMLHLVETKPPSSHLQEQKATAPPTEKKPVAPEPAAKIPAAQPVAPKPVESKQAAADEWQEFARSLESLTGRKK